MEAEPCREALLLDIRDLLTVMGAVGGAACSGGGGCGEQKARSSLMSALRPPSLKEFLFF